MIESFSPDAGEPFRVSDALEAGLSRAQLRAGDWAVPFWGIRSHTDDDDVRSRCDAFLPRMPARGFYFGVTAAVLHGIPVPRRKETRMLDIGVSAGTRRVDARGVVAHHVIIDERDLTTIGRLPITSPARTWCDLAASGLQRHEVAAAGDRILWQRDPLGTISDLRATLARYEGRRGTKLMRDVLPILSDGSDSRRETWLRVLILDAGLPTPTVQAEVANSRGHVIGHCDLGWPELRIGAEYEGDHHRTDRKQWNYDIRRYRDMEAAGWIIIRISAADLVDARARADLVQRLRTTIAARVRTSP